MNAIIRKELRELIGPALAIVLCAAVLAGIEWMYNTYNPHSKVEGLAVGIWLILSIALAFLGGAVAIARDGRQRVIFLTSWPQSRLLIWLAKAIVSFVLTMLVIVVGFLICLVAARASGGGWKDDDARVLQQLALFLPICFAAGLMWSGVINSVMGAAALGFATTVAVLGGGIWLFIFWLPRNWGPYLGTSDLPVGLFGWLGLAIPLIAGAWVFSRLPVLETWRRVRVGLGLLLGMVLLTTVGYLAFRLIGERPTLAGTINNAGLIADGKVLYFTTDASGIHDRGVWVMPVTGGRPRLLARVGTSTEDNADTVVLGYGNRELANSWAMGADLRLQRLRGYPVQRSPDGRYWATIETQQANVFVRDRRGRPVLSIPNNGEIVFAPDNRTLYYGLQNGELRVVDLHTQQERLLASLHGQSMPLSVSPDGRLLDVIESVGSRTSRGEVLIDTRTGQQRRLPDLLSPFYRPFVDGYIWCRQRDPATRRTMGLAVVEATSLRVVNTIPNTALQWLALAPWHRPGVPYVVLNSVPPRSLASPPGPEQFRRMWLAKPDGSGLRFLRDEPRSILGMADDGAIILSDRQGSFIHWNPVTNEERVIARL